jgi:hypothetical protein
MTPTVPPASTRPLWLAFFVLAATVTGGAAGLLAFAGGSNVPTAILAGGAAFAGTMALLVTLAHYLSGSPR